MKREPAKPTVPCAACDGEGISGEYVPELCGEGEDQPCGACNGTGNVELPCKYEVCPQCEGRGTSSAYLGAFTSEDWRELDDDFKEDYLAGRYDRACEACHGLRVVLEVDRARCPAPLLNRYDEIQQEEAEDRRMRAAESGWGYDSGYGF